MGLEIYDIDGRHIGRFRSAGAVNAFARQVKHHPRKWATLDKLMKEGKGFVTKPLLAELKDFNQSREGKPVAAIGADLLRLLKKCKQYEIISI